MNISNQWDVNLLLNFTNGEGVFLFGHRHTHDFTPNIFEAVYLGDGARYVTRVGGTHGLNNDRCVTTDSNVAYMNLPGISSHNKTPLVDDITDIKVGNNDHQSKQDGHANKVDHPFAFGFEALAATYKLNQDEQDATTIQSRER